MTKVKDFLFKQKTIIFFLILCLAGLIITKQPMGTLLAELITRVGRNGFLVLALLIPIQAGMGLNFALVLGAMAAQIGIFIIAHLEIKGIPGILVCALISAFFAIIFGFLTGKLFNKMKGSEMIGGIVLGYFAEGLYQLLFLFILGGVIVINNPKLMILGGVGVKNAIDLNGTIKYAIDDLYKMNFLDFITILIPVMILINLVMLFLNFRKFKNNSNDENFFKTETSRKLIINSAILVLLFACTFIGSIENVLVRLKIPIATYALIALAYVFNNLFSKTVLGQNIRTAGQNMKIAKSSGINVDGMRIISMIISTVLASWGQIILLQNLGTFSTYGAHVQITQFTIAALLVGGASVKRASPKQAIIGVILFHSLFVISPQAGKVIFGDPQIGEYFRVFVSYAVIAVSLALHAWQPARKKSAK